VRPRFHVPDVHASAARAELPEDEAEHLVRVLRLGIGDEVEVFDGRGGLWRAEVVDATKKSAAIRPLEPLTPARELGLPVTLVMSVLKGDKMDDVIRDAVMLMTAVAECERAGTRAWRRDGPRRRRSVADRASPAKQCAARWCDAAVPLGGIDRRTMPPG
jgi:16S rRNA (uracil1498-N3)-methyltransferase